MQKLSNIIISRTDSIGDIILAMPVAAVLKKKFPGIKVALLGRAYTREMALSCEHIDEFITVESFLETEPRIVGEKPAAIIHLTTQYPIAKRAKELKIPIRIGSSRRLYHWFTCNRMVWLNRKNSDLHEAQLNLVLLKPLGIKKAFSKKEIGQLYGLTRISSLSPENAALLDEARFNLVMHPKSRGSSREWPLEHFISLINLLSPEVYNIFLSGVTEELSFIQQIVASVNRPVTVIAGCMELSQFIPFIKEVDAVLSNSTGPVHIAAALGKNSIGLYPPMKTKDPGRWGPVGPKAMVFVHDRKHCVDCIKAPQHCHCMNAIEPATLKMAIDKLAIEKRATS